MMEQKVLATIQKHRMIRPGDNVIAALSGGADSVALFHILMALREQLGFTLAAAHFDHGLRGEESHQDASFCAELCERNGVTLYSENGDMDPAQKPPGESVEAWARRLRYAFFEALAAEHSAKVATAHTLSDNAETVLFHTIRGSGPRGLSGIAPVRGGFIRPLLEVTGEEVRAWCEAKKLAYVLDATNTDPGYTRNRLRLEAFPVLEAAHPGATRRLARMAGDMAALDAWLEVEAQALLERAGAAGRPFSEDFTQQTGWDAATLAAAPPPVRLQALAQLAGPGADRQALARMEAVVLGEAVRAQLAGGWVFCRLRGRLAWEGAETADAAEGFDYALPLQPGTQTLPGGYTLEVRCIDRGRENELFENCVKKHCSFAADCDKILQYGCLRTRQPKDRFSPRGRGVTKSLKKWMQEAGVPQDQRGRLPLVAHRDTAQVLWVWGGGFAEETRPGPGTSELLLIRMAQREEDRGGIDAE